MIAEECSANAHAAVSAAQVTAMQKYTQLLEREARTYEELMQMPGSVKFAPSTPVRSKPRGGSPSTAELIEANTEKIILETGSPSTRSINTRIALGIAIALVVCVIAYLYYLCAGHFGA